MTNSLSVLNYRLMMYVGINYCQVRDFTL